MEGKNPIKITNLTADSLDQSFFKQVFGEEEKETGLMLLGKTVFCTDRLAKDEKVGGVLADTLNAKPGESDIVKFLEMDDGTIITWVKNPRSLPAEAQKHWNNHDLLFIAENKRLRYLAYISIPCLGQFDHPEIGRRYFAPGGIRWVDYDSKIMALTDAMDMAIAVSMKIEVVEAITAGNKIAVMGDKEKKEEILTSLFAALERQGLVITAADLGLSVDDLRDVASNVAPTSIVPLGVFKEGISSAIPTADASVECILELIQGVLGKELNKAVVGIQGVGEVGRSILGQLNKKGVRVIVSEIKGEITDTIEKEYDKDVAEGNIIILQDPNDIFKCKMDIFIPCACRGILNGENLKKMKGNVAIVAGPANNLWGDLDVDVWNYHQAGIKVVPYEGIGAGGVVGVAYSITRGIMGREVIDIKEKIDLIKEYVKMIIDFSIKFDLPPQVISDKILLTRNRKNRALTKEESDIIIEKLRSAFQQDDVEKEKEIVNSITKNGFF